jgi:Cu+-exporting ATPase
MNDDNLFSVDDILKELDSKKSGEEKQSNTSAFAEEVESLTAEIAKIEKQRFGRANTAEVPTKSTAVPASKPKTDLSVTQILNDSLPNKSNKDLSVTQIINDEKSEPKPVKPVQIKRFVPAGASEKNKPVKKIKKKPADMTTKPIERVEELPPPTPAKAVPVSKPSPLLDTPEKVKQSIEEVTSDVIPTEKPSKPAYTTPTQAMPHMPQSVEKELNQEEKERLQKLKEEELLEKELALEDPDELLDGINPYDVQEIEIPTSLSAEDEIENIRITQNIDDAEAPLDNTLVIETVKEFKPSKKSSSEADMFDTFKEERSNDALVKSLNKKLSAKRESDINVRRTLNVDTLSSVGGGNSNYKGKTIPEKLNIDYKKQIIEDTSILGNSHDLRSKQLSKRHEETELGKKKKRKIRDFILEDINDNEDEDYLEEDESDEYDGYDSSSQIWQDLDLSHKGLTWRFVLLLLITSTLSVFTFIHDSWSGSGTPLHDHPVAFVAQMFSEPSAYASALVAANLIAGVIGMALCSGVIIRGFKHLFIGKADCDSACAVPMLLTTIATFAHISTNGGTALFEQGRAHVYVVVALLALTLNTFGKILMIIRAKKNFRFISGDSAKYSAFMPDTSQDTSARDFTKGILNEMPAPVFLRKTEFLSDFLKNSYCTDWADVICRKLVPISAILAILMGVVAYFLPIEDKEMAGNLAWAVTAGGAFVTALSPFMIMFIVNLPLLKAAGALSKSECVVMGYSAVQKFSKSNAVIVDAGILFPAGSVKFLNVKRCQKPNAIDAISIDESIIIAASLAIKSNSIMSSMFYDMISGDSDLLYKIENPIYEVNMGITGWMGPKRVMLGNREQMKHHGVDVPAENKERRHNPDNADVVYLAVGSETVAMFFIEVVPNPAVKSSLWELESNGVALAVKTKDSLVTVNKLADIFELDCERIRILPFDQHTNFDDYSRYTSRGSSEIACNGTFTSFARALVTAKNLIRDMMVTSAALFVSAFVAGLLGLMFVIFAASGMLSASAVIIYNSGWLLIMLILQALRRY